MTERGRASALFFCVLTNPQSATNGRGIPSHSAPPVGELSAQLTERAVQRRGYARLLLVKFNIAIYLTVFGNIRKCDRTIAPIINSNVGKTKETISASKVHIHGCLTGAALHNFIAIRWGHL